MPDNETTDATTQGTADGSTVTPPVTDGGTAASQTEQRVPLDRFRAVTDENKTLRSELEELQAWKTEQEQAALSEVERERQAREAAETELAHAQARAQTLERSQWVARVAGTVGFTDPEDASLLLDLSSIDSQDAAEAAVKDLAERKPHLLRSTEPQTLGTPQRTDRFKASDDPKAALGADLLQHLRQSR